MMKLLHKTPKNTQDYTSYYITLTDSENVSNKQPGRCDVGSSKKN